MTGSGLSLSMSSCRSQRQSVASRKSRGWPAGGRKAGTVAELILHRGMRQTRDSEFDGIFGSSFHHVGITHNPRDTRYLFRHILYTYRENTRSEPGVVYSKAS